MGRGGCTGNVAFHQNNLVEKSVSIYGNLKILFIYGLVGGGRGCG
jgi:hypothetical protein